MDFRNSGSRVDAEGRAVLEKSSGVTCGQTLGNCMVRIVELFCHV